ncbi:MAG: LacI family DNA-binding transcriptional regulator [Verrucomicrobiota bacterium]
MAKVKVTKKRPTLIDISEACGLSICTISRILNDSETAKLYAEETQQRVNQTAERLGYKPNRLARATRTSRTNQIGFIVHFNEKENEPAYPSLGCITGALEVLEQHGLDMVLIPLAEVEAEEISKVRLFSETFIDGAICTAYINTPYVKRIEDALQGLVVWCDSNVRRTRLSVWRDEVEAGRQAVEHLQTRNKKIIWIGRDDSHTRETFYRKERYEGGRRAALKTRVSLKCIYADGDKIEPDMILQYIKEGYDCVASEYPYASQVVSMAMRERLVVGHDFFLSCADDINFFERFMPDISRASFNRIEMGRISAEMLLKKLGRGKRSQKSIIQVPTWIEGATARA